MLNLDKPWPDAELKALPPIIIEDGDTDENGVTRGRHLRNPFLADGKPVEGEPQKTLARRWSEINWPVGDKDETDVDPFDALRAALNPQTLWHEFRGEDGALTVFPAVPVYAQGSEGQRAADLAWSDRSIEMHDAQAHITVEPKPIEDFAEHIRELRRGN